MKEKVNQMKNRNLKDLFTILYVVKNQIEVVVDDNIIHQNSYVITGMDIAGNRYIIDIVIDDKENNRFWLDVFESIKNRGVKRILFLSIETNKNISRALKISFPDTIIVFPLTDTINQFYKYISSRGKGNISKLIKDLCIQPNIEQFTCKVELLQEQYVNNYIVNILINNKLEDIKQTYKYDENVRKLLFSHNKNLDIYDKINTYCLKNYVKNNEELWIELWETILSFEKNKSFNKQAWMEILNGLTYNFNNEIIEAIKES
ncbi:MAG: transposase [Bacilli bacterium]|jgi:putative transposase